MEKSKPFALEAAWRRLRHWALVMLGVCGAPAMIAARLVLGRIAHEDLVGFLAPLESGVRRLLLIEALALPKPPASAPRAPASCAIAAAPARKSASIAFRIMPAAPRTNPKTRSRRFGPPRRIYNAAPLARRVEAVLRVLTDREPYVARLARRIHAEPAGTRFSLGSYRAPSARAAALLHDIEREAERAVARLNLARQHLVRENTS